MAAPATILYKVMPATIRYMVKKVMIAYTVAMATIGSVSPLIGLFGTVLGIIKAFADLGVGSAQNAGATAVMAGLSEALVATAIGLFAAIPAVIAYNRFSGAVDAFEARLQRFADRVHAQVSREMEQG